MVGYAEPNPILFKDSERREQRQTENKVLWLAMPSRILSYSKIVKGESRDKQKTKFYNCYAEPQPIFAASRQSSERREQRQMKYLQKGTLYFACIIFAIFCYTF